MSWLLTKLQTLFRHRPSGTAWAGKTNTWGKLGEPAPFSFRRAVEFYREHGLVTGPIDTTVEMFVGSGYHTTGEERAKQVVDDFAEDVNLDGVLEELVRDAAITGSAWAEKILEDPDRVVRRVKSPNPEIFIEQKWDPKRNPIVGLKRIDPLTMEHSIKFVPVSNRKDCYYPVVWGFVQSINGQPVNEFSSDQILFFRWKAIPGSPYGLGMVQPIVRYLQIIGEVEKDLGTVIKKFSWLRVAYVLEGATKDAYETIRDVLSRLKPGESPLIATTGETKFRIEPITIDPRTRFEYYLNHLMNAIAVGLECPSTMLFRGEVRVSDASATAMLDAFKTKISMKQRNLKRLIEKELFKPLVQQAGLHEVPKLNWGEILEPKINMADIAKFAEISTQRELQGLTPYITADELRKMLADRGYEIRPWRKGGLKLDATTP